MKKYFKYMLMAALTVAFSSCKDDDPIDGNVLDRAMKGELDNAISYQTYDNQTLTSFDDGKTWEISDPRDMIGGTYTWDQIYLANGFVYKICEPHRLQEINQMVEKLNSDTGKKHIFFKRDKFVVGDNPSENLKEGSDYCLTKIDNDFCQFKIYWPSFLIENVFYKRTTDLNLTENDFVVLWETPKDYYEKLYALLTDEFGESFKLQSGEIINLRHYFDNIIDPEKEQANGFIIDIVDGDGKYKTEELIDDPNTRATIFAEYNGEKFNVAFKNRESRDISPVYHPTGFYETDFPDGWNPQEQVLSTTHSALYFEYGQYRERTDVVLHYCGKTALLQVKEIDEADLNPEECGVEFFVDGVKVSMVGSFSCHNDNGKYFAYHQLVL